MPRLERWAVVWSPGYRAVLAGEVYEDRRFTAGHPVVTSPIVAIDLDASNAVTRNSVYRLGCPSPRFLAGLAAAGRTLDGLVDEVTRRPI